MAKKIAFLTVGLMMATAPGFAMADTNNQSAIAALLARIQALQAQIAQMRGTITTPQPSSSTSCVNLTVNMGRLATDATSGGQVTMLQNFLIANGYMTGAATGYYGNVTAGAVGQLQVARGIVASSADPAYGSMGPRTRASIACSGQIKLSAVPASGNVPFTTQFTMEGLNISGAGVTTYTLNFGDGSAVYTTSAVGKTTVSHTYSAAGTFTAKLTNSQGTTVGFATIVASALSTSAPWAIIDPASLITNSTDVTISGTAGNVSRLSVTIGGSSTGVSVTSGKWSAYINSLTAGSYTVTVADYTTGTTLAVGTLVINGPITLSATPSSATAGGSVSVSWSGFENAGVKDWIAIYPVGTTDYRSYTSYVYTETCTNAGTSVPFSAGTCSYPLPSTMQNGDYQFVLFPHDSYVPLALSNIVSVTGSTLPAATASLTANGATEITIDPGQTITYAWNATNAVSASSGYTVDSKDFCGSSGASSDSAFTFQVSTRSGTVTSKPIAACRGGHTYTVTYSVKGSDGQTKSAPVTIHVNSPMHVSPTTAKPGETVTVSWANIPNTISTDWIGIYPASATSYANFTLWDYVTCSGQSSYGSGSCPFTLSSTLAPGTYKFLYFKKNSYIPIASTETLTVSQ